MLRLGSIVLLLLLLSVAVLKSAEVDSLRYGGDDPHQFKMKQLAVPAGLMALGSLTFYSAAVADFDKDSRDWIGVGHSKFELDDYLQYSPFAMMWTLDALGLKSRHKFKQQTTILLTSVITTATLVNISKRVIARQRPGYGAYNSFPSGHTTTAFMGAELLRLEYGEEYRWVGILGYVAATATGFLRVYNDRHWVTDTVAGAGVGILSARVGYWLAPKLNGWLWGSTTGYEESQVTASLSPCLIDDTCGVGLSVRF